MLMVMVRSNGMLQPVAVHPLVPVLPSTRSVAGSGLPDSNTPGIYTFYAACSNSTTCRQPVTLTITARPTGVISGNAIYPAPTATNLSIAVTGTGPWSGTILPGNIPFSGSSSPITVSVTPNNTTVYTWAASTDNGHNLLFCKRRPVWFSHRNDRNTLCPERQRNTTYLRRGNRNDHRYISCYRRIPVQYRWNELPGQ